MAWQPTQYGWNFNPESLTFAPPGAELTPGYGGLTMEQIMQGSQMDPYASSDPGYWTQSGGDWMLPGLMPPLLYSGEGDVPAPSVRFSRHLHPGETNDNSFFGNPGGWVSDKLAPVTETIGNFLDENMQYIIPAAGALVTGGAIGAGTGALSFGAPAAGSGFATMAGGVPMTEAAALAAESGWGAAAGIPAAEVVGAGAGVGATSALDAAYANLLGTPMTETGALSAEAGWGAAANLPGASVAAGAVTPAATAAGTGGGLFGSSGWKVPLGLIATDLVSQLFGTQGAKSSMEDAAKYNQQSSIAAAENNRDWWAQNAFPNSDIIGAMRASASADMASQLAEAKRRYSEDAAKRGLRGGSLAGGLADLERTAQRNYGTLANDLIKFQNTPLFSPSGTSVQPTTIQPTTSYGQTFANTASDLSKTYLQYLMYQNMLK